MLGSQVEVPISQMLPVSCQSVTKLFIFANLTPENLGQDRESTLNKFKDQGALEGTDSPLLLEHQAFGERPRKVQIGACRLRSVSFSVD